MFEKIKYESTLVTFTEVPNEISLCFNISGCPCHCEGCFEPWLKDDIGAILTYDMLKTEILKHAHITCVCFMGGDRYYKDIKDLIQQAKQDFPNIKWAMYSGVQQMSEDIAAELDYYKVGPFIAAKGPLNWKTTNQIFYKKINNEWIDITSEFQKKKV